MEPKRPGFEISTKIGTEYVCVCVGEEFVETKLYFVCLLCGGDPQKYSALGIHLSSSDHQWKFLVSYK